MGSDVETLAEGEEGLFRYRKKILKMKLIFAGSVGTICMLAGFKYGYAKSKVKHGTSAIPKDATFEDPVKFAGRALKRATFLTVGCFVVGISAISIGFGIHSFADLRNISRRKWLNKDDENREHLETLDALPSDSNVLSSPIPDNSDYEIIHHKSDTLDNEIIVDKAEELTDKWG